MNRPVWSFRTVPLSGCELIEPLLPLYADGLASPAEIRLVNAHLPDCADCRASLSWIQATHAALASRPVAVPPADLQGRIALAIASSSAAPARVFSLRPLYAAAASLAALGIVFGLSHVPSQIAVKPTVPPKAIATVPAVIKTPALPKPKKQVLVASRVVKTPSVKRLQTTREIAPVPETPTKQVASSRVLETKSVMKTPPVKIPVRRLDPSKLIASNAPKKAEHVVTLPLPKQSAPKRTLPKPPLIASVVKEPIVAVHIQPPSIEPDPPHVRTASATEAPSAKFAGILGPVIAHLGQSKAPQAVSHFAVQQSYQGVANTMRMADSNGVRNFADIHGDQ